MIKQFALAALSAGALFVSVPASACNNPHLTGCVAPEIRILGGLNGADAATRIRRWRGEPVLIEFWSPRCSPCRRMLPKVERLHRRYRGKGLHVLAISLGSEARSKALVKKGKLTMPVGFDAHKATMTRYKVKAIPATFLVDKDGVVRPTGSNVEGAVRRELRRAHAKTSR